MADYFIGDLQGCYQGLEQALATVEFSPGKDTLWLTGDLVARGPDSLKVIKYLYKNQHSVKTVLGNHDLHFLAVANGLKRPNPKDLTQPLLDSKKLPVYLDWLRQLPLLLKLPEKAGYMTHAGLAPQWKAKDAKAWAENVELQLQSIDYQKFLPLMYGNKPDLWHEELSEEEKLKYAVSAFTRMRYCYTDGRLDFSNKTAPNNLDQKNSKALLPWFNYNEKRFAKKQWIFGHWASLMGNVENKNVIALDTGYVWGNYLTILHWQSGEKIKIYNNS